MTKKQLEAALEANLSRASEVIERTVTTTEAKMIRLILLEIHQTRIKELLMMISVTESPSPAPASPEVPSQS